MEKEGPEKVGVLPWDSRVCCHEWKMQGRVISQGRAEGRLPGEGTAALSALP